MADGQSVYKDQYETVAASQTDQPLGTAGQAGDKLFELICVVNTALTSQVLIQDGADTAIEVLPNAVVGGVGTYNIRFGQHGARSLAGAWQITTGAGVAVIAVGSFS